MPQTVLVIGATGMLGRPVTRALLDAGFAVRAMVRDVRRAAARLPAGCALVAGDLRDPRSIDAAIAGVDAVYLSLSNRMTARRPAWDADVDGTLAVADAARRGRVGRLLRLSAMGVEDDSCRWWVARAKREVDDALAASGLDYTIFRPTWFMESIPLSTAGPLLVRLPAPDDPLYWIAGADYGRQVAAAVNAKAARNTIYQVQGPEPVSMKQAVRRFLAVWRGYLLPVPMPRLTIEIGGRFVPTLAYLRGLLDMTYASVTKVPAEVNGHDLARPALTIEDYAGGLLESGDGFPSKGRA